MSFVSMVPCSSSGPPIDNNDMSAHADDGLPYVAVNGLTLAFGKIHLTCGRSTSSAMLTHPLPLSPIPCNIITVIVCKFLASTTKGEECLLLFSKLHGAATQHLWARRSCRRTCGVADTVAQQANHDWMSSIAVQNEMTNSFFDFLKKVFFGNFEMEVCVLLYYEN